MPLDNAADLAYTVGMNGKGLKPGQDVFYQRRPKARKHYAEVLAVSLDGDTVKVRLANGSSIWVRSDQVSTIGSPSSVSG